MSHKTSKLVATRYLREAVKAGQAQDWRAVVRALDKASLHTPRYTTDWHPRIMKLIVAFHRLVMRQAMNGVYATLKERR